MHITFIDKCTILVTNAQRCVSSKKPRVVATKTVETLIFIDKCT